MSSMLGSWGFEAHATNDVTYHDFNMAILNMGNGYHWEDPPNNIKQS